MKMCVICFDSLDYSLIEKYGLTHVKQNEFGRVEITGILSTPSIWTSFLTGLSPDEHKVLGWKWDNSLLDRLKVIGIKAGLDKIVNKSVFLTKKLGSLPKHTPDIKGKIPTIFDYAEKPIDLDVPCYGEDTYEKIRKDVVNALGNPLLEKEVSKNAEINFNNKRKKIMELLKNDWDLFVAHIYYPDIIQHLQFYREDIIIKMYEEIDSTAKMIQDNLTEDVHLLFISDHGQNKGVHTHDAFFSSNHELNVSAPKITDFYNIILKKLGVPTRQETDIIRERLKSLGYI